MPDSVQKVLQELTAAGLLSSDEITKFDRQITVGAEALLAKLVEERRITNYQAEKFLAGQGGDISFGDYVVLEELGRGGMGTVLLANHRRMDRQVAIKILSTTTLESEAAVSRFYQEVKVAGRLTHPNIVHAYDAGEHHGFHYLVMEYVRGHDLSRVLEQLGPIPVGLALDYIMQAARGLEYAHGKGVVHRDIKPSNLLVDEEGTVKILDMGLARIGGGLFGGEGVSQHLTSTGQMMGTVDYMSPEQAEDTRQADHRSDIYSLGCTLYRLLTDQSPFARDTIVKTILAHREEAPPPLIDTSSALLEPVQRVFQKMVAKNPDDRYQSTTALLRELVPLSEQSGTFENAFPSGIPATDPDSGSSQQLRRTGSRLSVNSEDEEIVTAQEVPPKSNPVIHINAPPKPHRGRRWLIMGIIGIVSGLAIVGGVLGVITWIYARTDLLEMERGERDPTGQTLTQTGKVLGMIAAALGGIGAVVAMFQ